MKIGNVSLPRKYINRLKIAYRDFYYKSREYPIPLQQQDYILETSLNALLDKALSNVSLEENYSEEKSMQFLDEVRKLTSQWKIELDDEYYNKGRKVNEKIAWWKFWRRFF
jgi:hypothetical protein